MEYKPFRYPIRSREVAKELISVGFSEWHRSPDYTMLEAPSDLSATKARKVISTMIAIHQADKEYERARAKYEGLVDKINRINGAR